MPRDVFLPVRSQNEPQAIVRFPVNMTNDLALVENRLFASDKCSRSSFILNEIDSSVDCLIPSLREISGSMYSLYLGASLAPRILQAAFQIQDSRDLSFSTEFVFGLALANHSSFVNAVGYTCPQK